MPTLGERGAQIFGVDYGTELIVYPVADDSGQHESVLEITVEVGDDELTVKLNKSHVRELRLFLQRYERENAKEVK